MTVISFTTVGYNEPRDLDASGRLLTIPILLGGLLLFALVSATVTSLLVRRELLPMFRTERMRKRIEETRGHVVLCGAGETGRTVIEEFVRAGEPFVVVEREEASLELARETYPDLLAVVGDATRDEILQEAGVERARGLITAMTDDADNLFVVISARSLNPELSIVARAIDAHTAGKMYKAGATQVLSPKIIEGRRMAAMVLRPSVVSFLDLVRGGGQTLTLEEVPVPGGSPFDGRTLRDLEIPQRTGLIVIAIRPAGEAPDRGLVFNPQSSAHVRAGDRLVVLGEPRQIDSLVGLVGRP